ncbi:MAG TPA: MBL fold metallo-hydrolase [Phycisphaerales bacterium]|nr:MBL fold metallo-hydrolase [Phycisphaerales bacterium]
MEDRPLGTFEQHAGTLLVLSSSSSGNCSALVVRTALRPRLFLIDAGLSPRRTFALLAAAGLGDLEVEAVLLTHLDSDHWNTGWLAALPERTVVHLHRAHRGRADRCGVTYARTEFFESSISLCDEAKGGVHLNAHDDLGTASFRIRVGDDGAELGFATDVGRVTAGLIDFLHGCDVLAIESNYCPVMQLASPRPQFLKDRIMGGTGHLSNEQSASAVRAIAPREHVVLLHLSRQCNTPQTARRHHAHAVPVTVAHADEPTTPIPLRRGNAPRAPTVRFAHKQPSLFS